MRGPTVLVVEDEPLIGELLETVLRRSGFSVWVAPSAETALDRLRTALATLAIVDWSLPGMSGPMLIKRLRQDGRTAGMSILMLTARDNEQDRVYGLEVGADDYLVKPFSPRELVARLKALVRRRNPELADEPLEVGPLVLDPLTYRVTLQGQVISLRLVEFRLLRYFMARPDRVHSRTELLDNVWGENVYVDDRTVDVHIRRLRLALGANCRDLIVTVRGGGYKLDATRFRSTENH